MKNYTDEIQAYDIYLAENREKMSSLSVEQTDQIKEAQDVLFKQQKNQWFLFNIVNAFILAMFILLDLFGIKLLVASDFSWPIFLVFSLVHGWIIYSSTIFTLHEGAAHKNIFKKSKFLNSIAYNFSRLFFADPDYYSKAHYDHHKYLGTQKDGAFTFLVRPVRVLIAFLPLSGLMPYCDYKIHVGEKYTTSRLKTDTLSLIYHVLILLPLIKYSILMVLVFIVISAWVAFTLDRLRENVDHSLLDYNSGLNAHSLGLGAAGWLVGGGPWGQPCHLSHHLAPSLNWYYQIILHYKLEEILNKDQKELVFIRGLLPLLRQVKLFKEKSGSTIQRMDTSP